MFDVFKGAVTEIEVAPGTGLVVTAVLVGRAVHGLAHPVEDWHGAADALLAAEVGLIS